jgi:hypothetical protein
VPVKSWTVSEVPKVHVGWFSVIPVTAKNRMARKLAMEM